MRLILNDELSELKTISFFTFVMFEYYKEKIKTSNEPHKDRTNLLNTTKVKKLLRDWRRIAKTRAEARFKRKTPQNPELMGSNTANGGESKEERGVCAACVKCSRNLM